MNAFFAVTDIVLSTYMYIVFAFVILTWLISFQVINMHSPAVSQIGHVLRSLVEPALRPIRQMLAKIGLNNLGGIDISPVVLMLALYFLRTLLLADIKPLLT